jgi:hypothetical protein
MRNGGVAFLATNTANAGGVAWRCSPPYRGSARYRIVSSVSRFGFSPGNIQFLGTGKRKGGSKMNLIWIYNFIYIYEIFLMV